MGRGPRVHSELTLAQCFHLRELIVEVQALRVKQCTRRLNDFSRDNLLHRELHLFQVDRGL
jgi:hypothetical protein